MPKPWSKREIGYMRHQKFLALGANAICLWHEAKDYCDERHTDGLIPREALRTFRFNGKKAVGQLLASCGPKPDGTPYAPLWETHPVGFKMHDYLDHNDCRDEVMARMEDAGDAAEIRKFANRKRQAEYRAKRKAELEALKAGVRAAIPTPRKVATRVTPVTPVTHHVTRTCSTPTETPTETTTETTDQDAPDQRAHPVREFLALYDRLFFDLHGERPHIVKGRDAKIAKTTIDDFTEEKARKLLELFFSSRDPFIQKSGYGLNVFAGQTNKLLTELGRSRAPIRVPWSCPHIDSCGHQAMCNIKLLSPHKYPVRDDSQVAS